MKKIFLLIPSLIPALIISGCGYTHNPFIKDDTLKSKAARALSTTVDKVAITERTPSGMGIDFVAIVGKKTYQCYVTTGYGITSDALCSGTDGVKICDELSKRAGRC